MGKSLSSESVRAGSQKQQKEASRRAAPDARERIPAPAEQLGPIISTPGVMVIYTPRDEREVAVCRWLFRVSYTFSLRERRRNSGESSLPGLGVRRNEKIQEPAPLGGVETALFDR